MYIRKLAAVTDQNQTQNQTQNKPNAWGSYYGQKQGYKSNSEYLLVDAGADFRAKNAGNEIQFDYRKYQGKNLTADGGVNNLAFYDALNPTVAGRLDANARQNQSFLSAGEQNYRVTMALNRDKERIKSMMKANPSRRGELQKKLTQIDTALKDPGKFLGNTFRSQGIKAYKDYDSNFGSWWKPFGKQEVDKEWHSNASAFKADKDLFIDNLNNYAYAASVGHLDNHFGTLTKQNDADVKNLKHTTVSLGENFGEEFLWGLGKSMADGTSRFFTGKDLATAVTGQDADERTQEWTNALMVNGYTQQEAAKYRANVQLAGQSAGIAAGLLVPIGGVASAVTKAGKIGQIAAKGVKVLGTLGGAGNKIHAIGSLVKVPANVINTLQEGGVDVGQTANMASEVAAQFGDVAQFMGAPTAIANAMKGKIGRLAGSALLKKHPALAKGISYLAGSSKGAAVIRRIGAEVVEDAASGAKEIVEGVAQDAGHMLGLAEHGADTTYIQDTVGSILRDPVQTMLAGKALALWNIGRGVAEPFVATYGAKFSSTSAKELAGNMAEVHAQADQRQAVMEADVQRAIQELGPGSKEAGALQEFVSNSRKQLEDAKRYTKIIKDMATAEEQTPLALERRMKEKDVQAAYAYASQFYSQQIGASEDAMVQDGMSRSEAAFEARKGAIEKMTNLHEFSGALQEEIYNSANITDSQAAELLQLQAKRSKGITNKGHLGKTIMGVFDGKSGESFVKNLQRTGEGRDALFAYMLRGAGKRGGNLPNFGLSAEEAKTAVAGMSEQQASRLASTYILGQIKNESDVVGVLSNIDSKSGIGQVMAKAYGTDLMKSVRAQTNRQLAASPQQLRRASDIIQSSFKQSAVFDMGEADMLDKLNSSDMQNKLKSMDPAAVGMLTDMAMKIQSTGLSQQKTLSSDQRKLVAGVNAAMQACMNNVLQSDRGSQALLGATRRLGESYGGGGVNQNALFLKLSLGTYMAGNGGMQKTASYNVMELLCNRRQSA